MRYGSATMVTDNLEATWRGELTSVLLPRASFQDGFFEWHKLSGVLEPFIARIGVSN